MVTFGQSIKLAYRQSFNFTGRATRAEYWWFVLFHMIASFVLSVIVALAPAAAILSGLFSLFSLPASLALVFRRVRDARGLILWPLMFYGALIVMIGYLLLVAPELFASLEGDTTPEIGLGFLIPGLLWLVSGLATFIYLFVPSRD